MFPRLSQTAGDQVFRCGNLCETFLKTARDWVFQPVNLREIFHVQVTKSTKALAEDCLRALTAVLGFEGQKAKARHRRG